ncbi:LptF/LptG family permease [Shimia sp. MMG029]|uniref:LptF/LptG family permease n=1 Tax=Shimia sp. MMG029 TaxID=3021978 RepID=UPI0022FE936A|nr:LptF/LptG family permease [Shimia sp. MMG029]MDA5557521.1 LptF/LptG family permease [Shimia sp. MMG029]
MSRLVTFLRLPVLRVLGKPLFLRLLLLLLVIEAIFLAESFTTLLEHALRLGGGPLDVAHLLSFKVPEILDLVLAMGLLIATYFATQDARNRGELMILATAGVHWGRVVSFVLTFGLIGGALSFANAGLILPSAKFGERLALIALQKEYVLTRIQEGGSETTLQTLRDTTFIATPSEAHSDQRGHLFVFQPDIKGGWRTANSENWHVANTPPSDTHTIELQALNVLEGPYPTTDTAIRPLNSFATKSADFAFSMTDALPQTDTTRGAAEKLLSLSEAEAGQITRLLSRALMVPMAGLLALAALVAGGGGPLRFVALPLAVLIMMSNDVASGAILSGFASSLPTALICAAAAGLYLGPPLAYLIWRGEALMKPEVRR